ncbi:hypothetical protein BJ878DRAFT_570932 [Calycina marina]|uniref:Dynamin-type G domain-containing protein n=1 Tax=Calycina marina TaxID=1763456 RepID=A0A9P8CCS4_9HELO|nr:hypothetical protein BJ878DRAFT_570932 [Calycina marina]
MAVSDTMSEDEQRQKGKGKATARPQYMQVGHGSTSESANRLQAILNADSGYGSQDGSSSWNPDMAADTPTPAHTPTIKGEHSEAADKERRSQATAIHQLWYNQHRGTLGRSINKAVETLKSLQEMNTSWPATYPSVQNAELSNKHNPRPSLDHTQSTIFDFPPRPGQLNRLQTSIGESETAESSKVVDQKPIAEPRLVTPQIAQQFSVLKLDLKLGNLHQTELVHSLEKSAVASLLDGQISSSIKHLLSLRDRIEDTSSKVLVTGDVNVGKSTFCNALLRRKVLPEDQLQNTSIFCEVLDWRENSSVEEVHAIWHGVTYNRHDESSYDVYSLHDLEQLVMEDTKYSNCKVYLRDVRSIDKSLLNNGVVDIAIIDAPSLNNDTTKTTAVFARQEEIDVVVFVVSASNQITLSAKEFIWAAANEKAYIFMVVNGYEIIKNKERFQKEILKQIHGLSPRTFKDSAELVHFVSSNAIPVAPLGPGGPDGGSGSGGSGSLSSGGSDDPDVDGDSDSTGKGKEKQKEQIQDFERLEESLRRFVLEKRARSKLAPAKTYLLNVIGDVQTLAIVNREVAQLELDRVTRDLADLEPKLEASQKAKAEVSDDIDRTIEETCKQLYNHTRTTLNSAISRSAEGNHGVNYSGPLYAFQYAEDLKEAMISQISDSLKDCEDHARAKTVDSVSSIKRLGFQHLGDEYADLNISFQSGVMFRRPRDKLARRIHIETNVLDFFDFSTLMQKQEKVAGTSMAMTVATVFGSRVFGGFGWVDSALGAAKVVGNQNLRRAIVAAVFGAAVLAVAYIINQIPHSLPQRLSTKIAAQLAAIDYAHSNSDRISSQVRKVLAIPANYLRVGLQRSVEQLGSKRDETRKIKGESEVARKYFGNLVNETVGLRATVDGVDLEGPAPGVAAAYDN